MWRDENPELRTLLASFHIATLIAKLPRKWSVLPKELPTVDRGAHRPSFFVFQVVFLQRYLAHKKSSTPLGSPEDPRHRPTVGS